MLYPVSVHESKRGLAQLARYIALQHELHQSALQLITSGLIFEAASVACTAGLWAPVNWRRGRALVGYYLLTILDLLTLLLLGESSAKKEESRYIS